MIKRFNSWKTLVILHSLFLPLALTAQDFQVSSSATLAETSKNSYSQPGNILTATRFTGSRRILFILVRYPDASAIVSTSQAEAHANIVKRELERNAYNQVSVTIDITPILDMPNPVSHYQASNTTGRIRADAVTVAEQKGFNIDSYDREVIFSEPIWIGSPALGTMNKRTIVMGHNLNYVTVHEVGHSLGFRHANFWDVEGSPIASCEGTNPLKCEIEYGDVYDMMGNGKPIGPAGFYHHFNPWLKYRVGWLPAGSILNVTNSGTYTIQGLDNPPQTGGAVYTALKIRKDAYRDYWVFYRSKEEALTPRGPVIVEIYNDNIHNTRLLDMSPEHKDIDDWRDVALGQGQTFSDTQAEISVKTVSVSSDEVQVEVTVNPTILSNLDNLPIMDVINPPGGEAIQGVVDYEATAFDPDFGAANGEGIKKVELFLSHGDDRLRAALLLGEDPPFEAYKELSVPPYRMRVDAGPINDGVYFIIVKATSTDGMTHYVYREHFIDNFSLPTTPLLISPNDNAADVSTSPTLAWNAANKAASYRLQVSTDTTFTTTLVDESGITTTSFQTPNLANSATYYWRVRARNPAGSSAWSSIWHFRTASVGNPPAAPVLSFPSDNASDVPIDLTLEWNSADNADSYHVQVSTQSDFATTVIDQSELTATSFALTGLSNSTTYYWRVSATNSNGTGPWSSVWQFTTIIAAPTAPLLSAPSDKATDMPVEPTLMWNEVTGAVSYRVQVSTRSDFGTMVVDQDDITGTSLQVTGLANATTYFWRVNATNAGGTSPWSSIWGFTTEQVTSVETGDEIPEKYSLNQNYPNPFNPSTNIEFTLPRREFVAVKIYNVSGKEIATIASAELPAGRHVVTFDADGLASGVYLYQIQTSSFIQTRKMLLLR